MTFKIVPVIMAGGNGTRLWPLSRSQYPKQFLALGEQGESLLQATINRLKDLDCLAPILICNEEHRFLAAEQLREINISGSIILEPEGKNTAPAITLAALQIIDQIEEAEQENVIMLVLAADHYIEDESAFEQAIFNAVDLAVQNYLVTFGIVPTKPETGYGYIQKGELIGKGNRVANFVEKPNKIQAEKYLEAGCFLWNSGMFVFKVNLFLEEMSLYASDILENCKVAISDSKKDMDFIRVNKDKFSLCRSESIDYAVMEKTQRAAVVPLDAKWSDIGSWSALWEIQKHDDFGNAIKGDVICLDSSNNYINAEHRLVTVLGLEDLIIVETKDAVLITDKDHVQDVKKVVEKIKLQERTEHLSHREVYRPWGKYDSIDSSERYQVKRITVKPGEKLSVQMHHHRSEHWIVVSGTAKVYKGQEQLLLTENQSVYIPVGEIHALENPGRIPLKLIEVQSGAYLGEDDIVRFEDRYGRN